jgi:hypothetical protein
MMTFTPAELFSRCSGDWPQIKEAVELAGLGMRGLPPRTWFSMLLNLDEGYLFLTSIGLVSGEKGSGGKDCGPNEHASTLNTFLASGKTQRDTRTSGNYGGSGTSPVNIGIAGNIHPRMLMAMERGLVGNHVQATKERFVYCAGRACRRHSDLPSDYQLPENVSLWTWLPLTARFATSFGWDSFYQNPDAAAQNLQACSDEESLAARADDCQHVGPAGGYKIVLRDGVSVRIRYVAKDGSLSTQYRISSRWRLPPPLIPLVRGTRQVVKFFETHPHMTIPFTEVARQNLMGAQLEQSLLASDANAIGDSTAEAQHGAAAGQIGIFAGLVRVLRMAATPLPVLAAGVVPEGAAQILPVVPAGAVPGGAVQIPITEEDVELATRVVQVSLMIKKKLREVDGTPDQPFAPAPDSKPDMPVIGDYDHARFANAGCFFLFLCTQFMSPIDSFAFFCVDPTFLLILSDDGGRSHGPRPPSH